MIPASSSGSGRSFSSTAARRIAPTGSPSSVNATGAAAWCLNAQLYVEWAISWGKIASNANKLNASAG